MPTMHVLHVVPSYYPALNFGGPVVSVYNLCNQLAAGDDGIKLRVLTTDTSGPRAANRLKIDERAKQNLYQAYTVKFCGKIFGTAVAPSVWVHIWRHVQWADVVHVTAVYSFTTIPALFAARILKKPVVWSPRGAFQRWSGTRRRQLKSIWEQVCRALISRKRTVLHVTSSEEARESSLAMPGVRCAIIPNGVDVLSDPKREWLPAGQLRLLFLGRLDPKKGIENLLEALAELREQNCSLRIYGSGSESYVEGLQKLINRLAIGALVKFCGPVEGDKKSATFWGSDVCMVPSFTENFGMVIAEALAHGVPVIASTGTPWRDLESRGAGRWVPNDPHSLATAIRSMRVSDLPAMGRNGREWMLRDFAWPIIAQRMTQLYREAVAGKPG